MPEHPIIFSGPMVRAILEGRKTQTRRVLRPAPQSHDDYEDYDGIVRSCEGTWYGWKEHTAVPFDDHRWNCPYGIPGDKEWQTGMPPDDWYYHVEGFAEDKPVYLRRYLGDEETGDTSQGLLWGKDEHDDPEAIEVEGLSLDTIKWKRCGDRLWVREAAKARSWTGTRRRGGRIEKFDLLYRADEHIREFVRPSFAPFKLIGWKPSIHMPRWACRIILDVKSVRVERVQDITPADAQAEGVDHALAACAGSNARDVFGPIWDSINLKRGYGWEANPWVWVVTFERTEAKA